MRNPRSRSIRWQRVANTASTAAKARWFTLPRRREGTAEDVVYEFDASGLIAAGLDPSRLQQLPERGRMSPGVWYFLPKGQQDPHHARAMSAPTIAIAINVKMNWLTGCLDAHKTESIFSSYQEFPLRNSANRRNGVSSIDFDDFNTETQGAARPRRRLLSSFSLGAMRTL